MKSKVRYFILAFLFLSLLMFQGSYQSAKPVFQYRELAMQKQVAISRGTGSSRPEIMFEEETNQIDELIVMTFNICHGVNQDGEESLDTIIESIRDTQAHIIALQEVDRLMPRSGFKDQAKEIADALGYYYIYGETINILGIKYGNAIISQFPILEHENKKLPGDSIETRGLLGAKIDVEGTLYQVYTTHLGLSVKDREKQIEAINPTLEQSTEPFIFMGDFNGEPFNEEMSKLSSVISDIAIQIEKDNLFTYAFYSDVPNTRIDRIYVSQEIEVIDHYVIESNVSDHYMVLGIISTQPKIKEGLIAFIGNNNK